MLMRLFVVHMTDPLAERTFRKDNSSEIDTSWAKTPGRSSELPQRVSSKEGKSKSDKHGHHHHHHHHKHDKHDKQEKHDHHHHKHKHGDEKKQDKKKETKSLLEEHLERMKSGQQPAKRPRTGLQQDMAWRMPGTGIPGSTTGSAYWDRERDMGTMRISRKTATDMLGRAESLSARFQSSGKSNHFM